MFLPDGRILFASYPGTVGMCFSASCNLNIAIGSRLEEVDQYVTQATKAVRKQEIRGMLLARLRDIIDAYDNVPDSRGEPT
jgi:hypothetical protein